MANSKQLVGWKSAALAIISGALLPLAFSPFNFYPLAVISLMGLFWCWQAADNAKQAFYYGGLFGLGMFGVGVSWVYVAIHVFGQSGLVLSIVLTFLFVAFLASYIAVLGWLLKKLQPAPFGCKEILLLLPVAWLGLELFRAWFLTGFPWLELGVSQIEGPLAGFVPIIGVNGVSLLVALTAALVLYGIQAKKIGCLFAIVLLWGGGQALRSVDWTQATGDRLTATLIQGSVPQQIKWQPEQLVHTLKLYRELSEQHWQSDLIVWPESALPAFYHQLKTAYLTPLKQDALAHGTDMLIGLPVLDDNGRDYYNSMVSLTHDKAFYHKRHLVPFGDYVPFEWLRGLIAFLNLPMSAFVPGAAAQPLLPAAGQQVGVSICYEDVFSTEVLDALPTATLLVNATNNAWYGDSFAPHQHLQISRSRALETGRPLIRATTNGISAFVDEKGQFIAKAPQFETATLTAEIQPRSGSTPYVSWQRWPIWLMSVFMLLIWAYYRCRSSD